MSDVGGQGRRRKEEGGRRKKVVLFRELYRAIIYTTKMNK
jgi:hypothetical protein